MLLCTPGYPQTFSLPFSLKAGSQSCITETAVKTKVVKGSSDKQRAGTTKTDNARPREVLIIYTQKMHNSCFTARKTQGLLVSTNWQWWDSILFTNWQTSAPWEKNLCCRLKLMKSKCSENETKQTPGSPYIAGMDSNSWYSSLQKLQIYTAMSRQKNSLKHKKLKRKS